MSGPTNDDRYGDLPYDEVIDATGTVLEGDVDGSVEETIALLEELDR